MREQRKVVTVLFADVVGSTTLASESDPEVVRSQMSRYFRRITEVAEAHGGTVEKFAGDAAMVVFGVPAVHDDDAERAVRAALEIREGAAELAVRVGVNTGEAVTAARDDRQFMVSGDAVNIAARLQQGAEPGEVVVGALTEQLTRAVIEYEPREPIAAKGKPEPLVAFRALRPRTQIPVQARGVPGLQASLVGRRRELRLLLDTFARTAEDRRPHLFTLVGAAGVGKSRLVSEALAALADSGARLLRGRCLPYGRGVTYWPLIEMLMQDTGIALTDERETALAKLERWLGELMGDDGQRPAIRARLSVMMGFELPAAVMADTPTDRVEKEIGWAVRRYLEAVAASGPVIVVVDDLQWAEPPVVAMVEHLAERTSDVPMLMVCIARPEFLENRKDWGAGKPNSTTITLDPLNPQETATLISRLLEIEALPTDLRAQIVDRSAGTPLFCEEFIHMLIDEGHLVRDGVSWRAAGRVDQIQVPHSVHAVIAARLDGLPESEKSVLQAASIIGQRFELNQVRDLASAADVEASLESLHRKGLVAGGDGAGDELRFRHLLIRDAAYGSMPKSERAALHDRFGLLFEAEAGDPQQVTGILAHHAERAFTLSLELALEKDLIVDRARRALDWSLSMSDRALTRHDRSVLMAALKTSRAAAATLPDGGGLVSRARIRLLEAQLAVMAADYSGASRAAEEAAEIAEQAGVLALVATARLTEAWIWNYSGEGLIEDFDRIVERAIAACQRAGDVSGEIEARHVGTNHLWGVGRLAEFIDANEQLLAESRSIGDSARAATILLRLANAEMMMGSPAASDGHVAEAEALAATDGLRNVALEALRPRAHSLFYKGEVNAAEALYLRYLAAAKEAGAVQQQVTALRFLGSALMHQHRWEDAAKVLDEGLELSEASGERWNRSELFGLRARGALGVGDLDLADRLIARAVELLRDEDVTAISEAHERQGMIRAAQGRFAEAESAFIRSLEVLAGTEYNWNKTSPTLAFAKFLAERGRMDEAAPLLEERARWCDERNFHLWDREIDEIRGLIAARLPSPPRGEG